MVECAYNGRRLVVRRSRLTDARQAKLWPDWRHFAFLADLEGDATSVDAFHRHHAVVELAIRDLKDGGRHGARPLRPLQRQQRLVAVRRAGPHLIRWT